MINPFPDVSTSGLRKSYGDSVVLHPLSLEVPKGGEARIHFDEGTVPDHLRANLNSLYVTSLDGKHVVVSAQADGFAAVQGAVEKDPCGA